MTPIPLLLLALLALAHAIGDFVLQTESIVVGKQSSLRVLSWHVLQHVLTMVALLVLGASRLHFAAPEAFPAVAELGALVLGIAATHLLVDKLKILAVARWGRPAGFFVADQAVHLVVLYAAVQWLAHRHPEWGMLALRPIYVLGQPHPVEAVATTLLVVAVALLVGRGGALLAWIASRGLRDATPSDEWQNAGLPVHALQDPVRLARGYAVRVGLLLLLIAAPWVGGIGLLTYAIWRGRLLRRVTPLVREFGRKEVAVDVGSVGILGGLVLWLTV